MAPPRQRGEDAEHVAAARGDPKIALHAEDGDDNLGGHAMTLGGAGERRFILRGDGATARHAAIGHGAGEVGGDGDRELRLGSRFGQHCLLGLKPGGRRLERLARHAGRLRPRPQALHKGCKIVGAGRRFGKHNRQGRKREQTQGRTAAGRKGAGHWARISGSSLVWKVYTFRHFV